MKLMELIFMSRNYEENLRQFASNCFYVQIAGKFANASKIYNVGMLKCYNYNYNGYDGP